MCYLSSSDAFSERSLPETNISRRQMLKKSAAAIGLCTGAGCFAVFARQSSIGRLQAELIDVAAPILAGMARSEFASIPTHASEQVALFFHSACLNTHRFVAHVTSFRFKEQLALMTTEESRHEAILLSFEQHIVSKDAVLTKLQEIVREHSRQLQANWSKFWGDVEVAWKTPLHERPAHLGNSELLDLADNSLKDQLDAIVAETATGVSRPAYSNIPADFVATSSALMPLARITPKGMILVLIVAAVKAALSPITASLLAPNEIELIQSVSRQLSVLGNHVASEFEQLLVDRLLVLNHYRATAVATVAEQQAKDSIRWIS